MTGEVHDIHLRDVFIFINRNRTIMKFLYAEVSAIVFMWRYRRIVSYVLSISYQMSFSSAFWSKTTGDASVMSLQRLMVSSQQRNHNRCCIYLLISQLSRCVNASVNANGAFCLPENIAGAIFAM